MQKWTRDWPIWEKMGDYETAEKLNFIISLTEEEKDEYLAFIDEYFKKIEQSK